MGYIESARIFIGHIIRLFLSKLGIYGGITVGVAYLISQDSEEIWNNIREPLLGSICDATREKTGLELDPGVPLSDESLARALSMRSGIQINSVMSADGLVKDLTAHASKLLESQTGILLTDLLSAEQVKVDLVMHAEKMVYEHTKLDIRGAMTFDDVQKRIGEAVEKRLSEIVVERLRRAAEEFSNPEATLDELLAMIYHAEDIGGVKARDVALGVAASMVVAAYARLSTPIKRRVDAFRRRAQNRAAQRRFRARHGNRMTYNGL